VLQLVIGAGMRFGIIGIVVGLGITLLTGRFVAPLLFEVSPRDPVILSAVGALLLGVAVVASGIPALRATRVDPNVAVRAE
jgi:ABC-type antimicrobial peptide transport system permease subunit